MKPSYLKLLDLRLALRWVVEAASPGKIAVAVSEHDRRARRNGRIVLLDPTDGTRNMLLDLTP